jgi:hypothetical protein
MGEKQVSLTKRRRYLGVWLLFVALLCGACSGKQTDITAQPPSQDNRVQDEQQDRHAVVPPRGASHGFDNTEVDLEYGPLQSASRYHRPQGIHLYTFDNTEVDLEHATKKINPSQSR